MKNKTINNRVLYYYEVTYHSNNFISTVLSAIETNN